MPGLLPKYSNTRVPNLHSGFGDMGPKYCQEPSQATPDTLLPPTATIYCKLGDISRTLFCAGSATFSARQ